VSAAPLAALCRALRRPLRTSSRKPSQPGLRALHRLPLMRWDSRASRQPALRCTLSRRRSRDLRIAYVVLSERHTMDAAHAALPKQPHLFHVPCGESDGPCRRAGCANGSSNWCGYRSWQTICPPCLPEGPLGPFRRCCRFRSFHLAFWLLLSFARDALVHLNAIVCSAGSKRRCVKREAHRTHTEALGSSAQMRCVSC